MNVARRRLRFKPGTAEVLDDDAPDNVGISIEVLREALGGMADIKMPGEADEPILARPVREAVLEWLVERRALNELQAVGLKPRSTTLLYGPPGCGKTTLAHHFAARLGYPLVIMQMGAVLTKWLSGTGENVYKFFDLLRAYPEPCAILLDELDAIGAKRGTLTGGAGEKDANSVVNILLIEIERFNGIMFAATNRQDDLDPALWRRFGMQIEVALPSEDERFAILKRYGMPFQFTDEFLGVLCDLTAGAAPSLLRQVMEAFKRSLVLGPKLKLPIDDPVALLQRIAGAVRPHQDYIQPPLWLNPGTAAHLKGLAWPPVLPEGLA